MKTVSSENLEVAESRTRTAPQPASCNPRFYRLQHLVRTKHGEGLLGGVSGPTVWRWVKSGAFPKPIKLGPNSTAFSAREVDAWINSKLTGCPSA